MNLKSTTGPEDGLDTSKWSVEECWRFFEEARRSLVQRQAAAARLPSPTSGRSPSTVAADQSSPATQQQIAAENTSTQAPGVKNSRDKPKKPKMKAIFKSKNKSKEKQPAENKQDAPDKQQGTGSPPSHPVAPAATDEQVRNPFNGPLLNEALVRPRPAIAIQASPETLPQNPLPDTVLPAPTVPAAQAAPPNPPENDGNPNPAPARPQPQNRFDQAIGWIKNALDGLRSGISGISSFFRNLFR